MITLKVYNINSIEKSFYYITFNPRYLVAILPWNVPDFEPCHEGKYNNGYLIVIESRTPNHYDIVFEKYFITRFEYEDKILKIRH